MNDILIEWIWQKQFSFIHMRLMLGAFTPKEWETVYKKCYEYVLRC